MLNLLYTKRHQTMEKLIKIESLFKLFAPLYVLPYMTFCYYKYFTSNYSNDSFELILPTMQVHFPINYYNYHITMWFTSKSKSLGCPLTTKHQLDFFSQLFLTLVVNPMVELAITVLAFAFVFYQYVETFIEDFTISFNDLDTSSRKDDIRISKKVYDILKFHTSVKR